MLKSDLHIHTSEDPDDFIYIKYNCKDAIKYCEKLKFDVLSITLHGKFMYSKEMIDYAKKHNVLLIPGVEVFVGQKHVLVYNIEKDEVKNIKTYEDIEKLKDHALVCAPHPFFMFGNCVKNNLLNHIDLFDAIEHSHFYTSYFNLNKKAIEIAKKYKKTLLANSDAHFLENIGTNYSLIDAKKNKESVLEAIRKNKVEIVSRPLSNKQFVKSCFWIMKYIVKQGLEKKEYTNL